MDLVVVGGNVLTMDSAGTRAQAVAVDGGKISAVGSSAEIGAMAGPETRVVNLAGRALIPGFIDPHNHFSVSAMDPVAVDCSNPPHEGVKSIMEAIAAAASAAPNGRWIRGWGFSARRTSDGRRITRAELDEAAPNNPVFVVDSSVHCAYVNSQALALGGIDKNTPDPPHGEILKDKNGEPNGTLWEHAMDATYNLSLRSVIDVLGDDVAGLVEDNAMKHLALGITSVGDACTVPAAAEMYRIADRAGKLPMVVHQLLAGKGFFTPPEEVSRGEVDGDVSDRLRGGTMKIFMDPVFPGAGYMKCHPSGDTEQVGTLYYTQEEVDSLVINAHQRGIQVAIHALGNGAVELALNAFARAIREHPAQDPRFRIEHGGFLSREQLKRQASMGVIASGQPPFVFGAGPMVKDRMAELGGDLLFYPFKTMLSEGVHVAASSDCPCAPLDPLFGVFCAVTRPSRDGSEPVGADEAVSAEECLKMYTAGGAYAMRRETEVGSLEKGKRADLAVLSHDPTAADPQGIRDIVVEQTYVEGRQVYRRGTPPAGSP